MKVFTAPDYPYIYGQKIFLAGGITNCSEWQKEVINYFKDKDYDWILCNPRRDNFPKELLKDREESYKQIKWEFVYLESCDVFSIYFDNTEQSDQPICFYELGRNICRMQARFPDDWYKRIIITCHKDFKRLLDVEIQTDLATDGKLKINKGDVYTHIESIEKSINLLS